MNRLSLFRGLAFLLFLCLLYSCATAPRIREEKVEVGVVAEPPKPEFRAAWVTRFEWPDPDPEKCRQNIRTIFENLQKANFNAAVFQVRGQADVLYPSAYEPWSPLIGGQDPGWDPLAFAIEEAHRRGIEFHAYVNPIPLWGTSEPPAHTVPEHLYHRHGPEAEVSWVCHDATGEPMQVRGNEYYYLSPGVPGVHEYLRTVLMDLVERYNIDGIHYDRIRYPGRGFSHDPISVRRFNENGNPNNLEWEDWQREQLNKLVNDLFAQIAEVKPHLRVSCAAWGIYDRHAIPGYSRFSSGYHDYYQDSIGWVRLGAMDTLMPMIYWDIPDPKPNFDELMEYFASEVGGGRLVGGMIFRRQYLEGEVFDQINAARQVKADGTVIFSYNGLNRADAWDLFREKVYPTRVPVPTMPWKDNQPTGILSGQVVDSQGKPVVDAIVQLDGVEQKWTSSEDGYFAFLKVAPGNRTVRVTLPGGEVQVYSRIAVEKGEVTFLRCAPQPADAAPILFRIIEPKWNEQTSSTATNVAVHTDAGNKAYVNGNEVHVYRTGIFVDRLALGMGMNRVEIAVETPEGTLLQRVRWVRRVPPRPPAILPTLPLQIEEASIQPEQEMVLQPGDLIPVRFKGSPGHAASFRVGEKGVWQPMLELPAEGQGGIAGIYSGVYQVQQEDRLDGAEITVRLEKAVVETEIHSPDEVTATAKSLITTLDPATPLVAEVSSNTADLKVGLGEVRLGGPILTTVPQGTRLHLTGRIGSNWRVRLSETMQAWVERRTVTILPPGTQPPEQYLTSFTVTGDSRSDLLYIPNPGRVPFRIRPIVEPNSLWIDFYGVVANTTWITIKTEEAKGIRQVDWEQVEKDLYRLIVELDYPQQWGYDAVQDGNTLRVRIKRPPELASPPHSPVYGLTVAVEAGHGGPTNTGARGLSGSMEKDVNYGTTVHLVDYLESAGAQVVMMRQGDESISLQDRIQRALDGNADVLISIHANAGGTAGGYLRVSGTSTYYRYTPWRPLAETIYVRLLELGLDPFGLIGSFNYRPCLVTQMPSILVELAFMSHPGDEELLVDPEFQQQMAHAIFKGLEDFLNIQLKRQ